MSGGSTVQPMTTRGCPMGLHSKLRLKQRLAFACTGLLAIAAIRCDRHQPTPVQPTATQGVDIPDPTASDMEPRVRACVDTARRAVQSKPESALAWGEFGTVCDAHSFHEAAVVCYQQARTLAPRDFRWAYFAAIVADGLGEARRQPGRQDDHASHQADIR